MAKPLSEEERDRPLQERVIARLRADRNNGGPQADSAPVDPDDADDEQSERLRMETLELRARSEPVSGGGWVFNS